MVDGLLDTSIIVDILRSYPPAQQWFGATNLQLGVTKFVWLEVIEGAISKRKQKHAIQVLNGFTLVPIDVLDIDWALVRLTNTVLAYSGIDLKDCLIASTSSRLQLPLYTQNLKHMRPLIGLLAQIPY